MQTIASPARLSEHDVRRMLHPEDVILAVENAFRGRFPAIVFAPRPQIEISGGVLLMMSCYDPSRPALGLKLVTVRNHLPASQDRVHATFLLLDPQTAEPVLSIAANYLTALRTAATSAVATRFLSRENAETLGVFGTGQLARTHLTVLPMVRNFQRALVCGREPGRTRAFAEEMSAELGRPILAADPRTLARESDVLCACTNSPTPLFDGGDLRPGTHLNLLGTFTPRTREADTVAIQRSRVFVETYDAAAEAGDIVIPIQEGAIANDHVVADLHELLSGKKLGRLSPEAITVFKSVGSALEDLVTAELLQLPAL